MKKKLLLVLVALVLAVTSCLFACAKTEVSQPEADPVTITIIGGVSNYTAMETVCALFKQKYSNCTVVYEYVNDYFTNSVKRMEGDDCIDLFLAGGIQTDDIYFGIYKDYAFDLLSDDRIDFSQTFEPLSQNYRLRENNSIQYSIPLGSELRGMFVNVSLLKACGINSVPTNQSEFMAACQILLDKGYVPIQGNPYYEYAPQWLMYPWVCNAIANAENYDTVWAAVNNREGEVAAEYLREPFEFLYKLCENKYYDYKRVEKELGMFKQNGEIDLARYFLNLVEDTSTEDKDDYTFKDDSVGYVPFMPAPISFENSIEQMKADYQSDIEYVFVPAPIGEDGGFVYLSPAGGLAINKNSKNLEWAIKFMNFMFTKEINETYADEQHIMPNSSDVFDYVSEMYDVPKDNISHLGEVSFNWKFYDTITAALQVTAKANKPSTMEKNATADNPDGELFPFDWYMNSLANAITAGEPDTKEP